MSDKARSFQKFFFVMMMFVALCGVWTVAIIMGWPWEKTADWKPDYRLAAVCGEKDDCSVRYGDLASARADGKFRTLKVPPAGEAQEDTQWISWKTLDTGVIEAKASSWHFQSTIRYRLDDDETPVLVATQDISTALALNLGIGAALFTLLGLYLRKLRG